MKYKKSISKPGMAYVYVIMAFLILTIILTCVISLFSSNLTQAKLQEKQIQAYYISMSGIELSRAALLQKTNSTDDTSTILYKRYSISNVSLTKDTPVLADMHSVKNGKAIITVTAYDNDEDDGKRWIKILSVGFLENSEVSQTISVCFPVDNPEKKVWGKN